MKGDDFLKELVQEFEVLNFELVLDDNAVGEIVLRVAAEEAELGSLHIVFQDDLSEPCFGFGLVALLVDLDVLQGDLHLPVVELLL